MLTFTTIEPLDRIREINDMIARLEQARDLAVWNARAMRPMRSFQEIGEALGIPEREAHKAYLRIRDNPPPGAY
jgi:hypothetical protein